MNRNHLKDLGKYLVIIFLIKVIFGLIVFICIHLKILDLHKILASEVSVSDRYGIATNLILLVIIAPVIEEIAFRGWLSYNKNIISVSLIVFLFYAALIAFNTLLPSYGSLKYMLIGSVILIPAWAIWIKKDLIAFVIASNQKLLIHISVILFTIAHAFNYEMDITEWRSWISLFVLLLPYPPVAYILTNVRMKSGLIWSISLHAIVNSMLLVRVLSGFDL